ncbi:MAG TPA: hypothetical protein VK659_08455 [Asanoa sp.]|nr:hypothetical protein [Asanoa sp.]
MAVTPEPIPSQRAPGRHLHAVPALSWREQTEQIMAAATDLLAANLVQFPAEYADQAIPYTVGQIRALMSVAPPVYPDGGPTQSGRVASP